MAGLLVGRTCGEKALGGLIFFLSERMPGEWATGVGALTGGKPLFLLDSGPLAPVQISPTDTFGHAEHGPIAQLAEPPAHNRLVLGSNPSGPTM